MLEENVQGAYFLFFCPFPRLSSDGPVVSDFDPFTFFVRTGFFELQLSRDKYREMCLATDSSMREDLIFTFIRVQLHLLSPVCPHLTDYIWRHLLPGTPGFEGGSKRLVDSCSLLICIAILLVRLLNVGRLAFFEKGIQNLSAIWYRPSNTIWLSLGFYSILTSTWPKAGVVDELIVKSSQHLMDTSHDFRIRMKKLQVLVFCTFYGLSRRGDG